MCRERVDHLRLGGDAAGHGGGRRHGAPWRVLEVQHTQGLTVRHQWHTEITRWPGVAQMVAVHGHLRRLVDGRGMTAPWGVDGVRAADGTAYGAVGTPAYGSILVG